MSNWKDNWTKDKRLNSSLGMLGGASSIFSSAYGMATPNTDIMMSNIDNQIDSMKNNQVTMQPSSLDSLLGQWAGHQYLDTDYNAEDYYTGPSGKDILTNTLNSTISGATTGATAGPLGALIGGAVGLGSGLIGGFIGKNKAEEAAEEAASKLREEATSINNFQQASFMNAAKNIQKQNARMLASKVAAFGGALGGYGADWTNGLTMINNGGTHGENPLGGVPMGIAQDGQPNLVEEGEVIWNDYVFSNRLKVPNKIKEKYKLKGNTFAEVVNKAQEASAERPNDSIEKRGLDSLLNVLMQEQEMIRQKKNEREQRKNINTLGGKLFASGGPTDDYWWADEYDKKRESNSNNKGNKGNEGIDTETIENNNTPIFSPTLLRYAPILGNTIGLGYTLLNPVSHKYADELDKAALEYTNALPKVSPTMLGDYLAYNPFDRMFYANELGAQQAASRRAIINNSANKGAALAGLLASDYANNVGLGKLYREGKEYNLAQRQKVADFNRGTNMANMEADLKAQMANAEMDRAKTNLLLDAKIKSLGMKQAGDAQWDANLATNLSGLFNNLGDIGWEAINRNMVNSNLGQDYIINNDGTITYKGKTYAPKKNGGYLTIRRKRNA